MEKNTNEAPAQLAQDQIAGGSIERAAQKSAVAPWQQLQWTDERVSLMRKAITPPSATEAEFAFFLEWCKQTGLNPFLKQAYLIERRAQVNGAWVSKHDPMVAEAGFAARADALPDFRGMKSGVVYAGDEFMIDEEAQTITHRWSVEARAKGGNKIVGAWAHGFREGRVVEITYLTLESRIQGGKDGPTKFWKTDPAGQLRKCARADQYRRLYPNIFAGWYDVAEVRDDEGEVEVNAPPASSKAPTAKSAALAQRLGVKPLEKPKTVEAAPSPKAEAKKDAPAPKASPPAKAEGNKPLPIDQIRFGPNRGQRIVEATTLDLEAAVALAQQQLANATGKEGWIAGVKEGLQAINDELAFREKTAVEEEQAAEAGSESAEDAPPPEPGSEG